MAPRRRQDSQTITVRVVAAGEIEPNANHPTATHAGDRATRFRSALGRLVAGCSVCAGNAPTHAHPTKTTTTDLQEEQQK